MSVSDWLVTETVQNIVCLLRYYSSCTPFPTVPLKRSSFIPPQVDLPSTFALLSQWLQLPTAGPDWLMENSNGILLHTTTFNPPNYKIPCQLDSGAKESSYATAENIEWWNFRIYKLCTPANLILSLSLLLKLIYREGCKRLGFSDSSTGKESTCNIGDPS